MVVVIVVVVLVVAIVVVEGSVRVSGDRQKQVYAHIHKRTCSPASDRSAAPLPAHFSACGSGEKGRGREGGVVREI